MQSICPKCGEIQPGQSLNVHLYRSTVSEFYEAWIPDVACPRGQGKTPEKAITNLFKRNGTMEAAEKLGSRQANTVSGGRIERLFSAYNDLRNEGWQPVMYAPKDREIEVIELGSVGIHKAVWFSFDRPGVDRGRFFIDGDSPSDPILWREIRSTKQKD